MFESFNGDCESCQIRFFDFLAKWQLKIVTVSLLLIIQLTAASEDERQFVRHGGQEWTTLKRLAADHHNRLEEEAPRLLGIGTEPEFAIGQRALSCNRTEEICSGLPHASRRPDRCRASRARRYLRHRDLASALLHDDGGMGGAIRCANVFAHCRSRVCDAQESAHPILGRNNAFVVGWSDTDQLRRTLRGRLGPAAIQRILERIEPFSFEQIYGAWWKANVLSDAKAAARRSTERYLHAISF